MVSETIKETYKLQMTPQQLVSPLCKKPPLSAFAKMLSHKLRLATHHGWVSIICQVITLFIPCWFCVMCELNRGLFVDWICFGLNLYCLLGDPYLADSLLPFFSDQCRDSLL